MGARNILRLLTHALKSGPDKLDLVSGDILKVLPVADNVGAINIGDGTNDIDFKAFLGASTDYVEFDVSAGQVNIESAELHFGDNDSTEWGDGNDLVTNWNGSFQEVTAAASALYTDFPSVLDPSFQTHVAYEKFDDFFEVDTTATVGNWVLTSVGTGTPALADDLAGGHIVLTCQSTTDDACHQYRQVSAPFKLAAGKTLWFEIRFKLTGDATQSEVAVGLVAAGEDLTAVADVKPQDGIAFTKQDGATGFALTASKNGTNTGESGATLHTCVSGSFVRLGFVVDGLTSVTPYVDGVAGTAITATIVDDESLAIFFLVRNGDATTQEVLDVDYVRCVQLR